MKTNDGLSQGSGTSFVVALSQDLTGLVRGQTYSFSYRTKGQGRQTVSIGNAVLFNDEGSLVWRERSIVFQLGAAPPWMLELKVTGLPGRAFDIKFDNVVIVPVVT